MKYIIRKLNRIKVILFYSSLDGKKIYKHNVFYRLLSPIIRIYNNIKYILTNDLKLVIEDVMVDYNESIDNFNDSLNNLEYDIEKKCGEYEVEEIITNQFGYCEDYINYDDKIDIEDKIKALKDEIKSMNNNNNDDSIERDLLIDEVIKSIINRLELNDNV